MRLIITEKKKEALKFALALGMNTPERALHFEQGEWVVAWAQGHLLELYSPEEYDPKYKEWKLEDLPILPETMKYRVNEETKHLYASIKAQVAKNPELIVMATDPDREGELIGRTILKFLKVPDERIRRFWTSDVLTPEVIRETLERKLQPMTTYEKLFWEGKARSYGDWYVGYTHSRLMCLKTGGKFSVGRVQTAIVGLVCQREKEITSFIKKPYYELIASFEAPQGPYKGKLALDPPASTKEAFGEQLRAIGSEPRGVITKLERKEAQEAPPRLPDLSSIQQTANKWYGLTASSTMEIVQKLYDEYECVSYPRTETQCMNESLEDVATLTKSLAMVEATYPQFAGLSRGIDPTDKQLFNAAKWKGHHALIPLAPLPKEASLDEKRVYGVIVRSLVSALGRTHRYYGISITTQVKTIPFTTKGREEIDRGWRDTMCPPPKDRESLEEEKGSEDEEEAKHPLPPGLAEGMEVKHMGAGVAEKWTTPPKRFTEASLLAAMKNPNRYRTAKEYSFDDDTMIGTAATQEGHIAHVIKKKYLDRDKRHIVPTTKGMFLYEELLAHPAIAGYVNIETTAKWEKLLREDPKNFHEAIKAAVRDETEALRHTTFTPFTADQEEGTASVGHCPLCNRIMKTLPKSYTCSGYFEEPKVCTFVIWRQQFGGTISPNQASKLISKGKTDLLTFENKDHKKYQARLKRTGPTIVIDIEHRQ